MAGRDDRCYVSRFGPVVCHLEVTPAPGQSRTLRGVPWVEDGLVLRPVLNEVARPVELLAETDEAVLTRALEFLERRFGRTSLPPQLCREAQSHIRARSAPLRWTDLLH
jgi:hypothetical protein